MVTRDRRTDRDATTPEGLEPYLARMGALSFVKGATAAKGRSRSRNGPASATPISLRTTHGKKEVEGYVLGSNLDYLRAEALSKLRTVGGRPMIVFAPYVAPPMARFLAERSVNFVDLHGNCRVVLDGALHAEVVGKRPERRAKEKGWRTAGYWTLFALLADPKLLGSSVRNIAQAAGVGKTAAAEVLARLRADGAVGSDGESGFLPGARSQWASRWIEGYANLIRPASIIGRFRTPERDPQALEARVSEVFGGQKAVFGGAAGAYRLGGLYRSEQTVLHVEEFDDERRRALRAMPARDGELVVLKTACPAAYAGEIAMTAHPLLLYAEISATAGPADDRLRQAGDQFAKRFLPWI